MMWCALSCSPTPAALGVGAIVFVVCVLAVMLTPEQRR